MVERVVRDLTNENLEDALEKEEKDVTKEQERNVTEENVTENEVRDVTIEILRSAVRASSMRRVGFRSPFSAAGGSGGGGRSTYSGLSQAGPAGGCRPTPR